VLSLWDGPRCTGTVRVAAADVPALIEALQIGSRAQPAADVPTDGPSRRTASPAERDRVAG
jgi:hypothetical protein